MSIANLVMSLIEENGPGASEVALVRRCVCTPRWCTGAVEINSLRFSPGVCLKRCLRLAV